MANRFSEILAPLQGLGRKRSTIDEGARIAPGVTGIRTFTYEAISAQGVRHKGRMQAPNRQTVTQTLQADGWVPLAITEVSNSGLNKDITASLGMNATATVSPSQVANLARQLAQLLSAGVPTSRALYAIGEEQGGKLQQVCVSLSERTSAGIPLSDAMRTFPEVFDEVFIAYIRAGEAAGSLADTVARLARSMERKVALSQKIKAVTAYPKIVSMIIGFIVLGIITFIVPRFASIYATFGAPLPTPTRVLQSASKYIFPFGGSLTLKSATPNTFFTAPDGPGLSFFSLIIRVAVVGAIWFLLQMRRNKKGKRTGSFTVIFRILFLTFIFLFTYKWHIVWPSLIVWGSIYGGYKLVMLFVNANRQEPRIARYIDLFRYKLPVFGQINRLAILYRWTSTLSGAVSAGVALAPSLELAATTSGSDWHRAILSDMQGSVRAGKPLSEVITMYPELFPASVRSMVATGEQTGDLSTMLDAAAAAIDSEIDALTSGLAAKVEVLLLVVMGVVVGGLLVVLYLPILRLATTVSNSTIDGNTPQLPDP
jgi:type II secretory pathway component PulF